jgi:hypothetical protein
MHFITITNAFMLIFVKNLISKHFRKIYCLFIYTFGAIDGKKHDQT